MTKFFLSGPVSFLPKESLLNGILSLPFICLCLLNTMFCCRTLCIESAFFTTYVHQVQNVTTYLWSTQTIKPFISPEFRLLAYLFPCIISFLINGVRLFSTTKGLRKHFIKYPQFIIASCFTPFMFEGQKVTNSGNEYNIRVWRLGTLINAIYIGCIPQCVLLFSEYYRSVSSWKFIDKSYHFKNLSIGYESNDALIKTPHGNTTFAVASCIFFFLLILVFFCTKTLFENQGIYCKFLNILCCPCPGPCVHYSDPSHNPSSLNRYNTASPEINIATPNDHARSDEDSPKAKSHTNIYVYKKNYVCIGEKRMLVVGQKTKNKQKMPLQVTKVKDFTTYVA